MTAAGFVFAATLPGWVGLRAAAITIGAGSGIITPLAFAALAASTSPERLGDTMGAAEVGRELGDAGGPLLVGAIAAATTLATGLLCLAAVLAGAAALTAAAARFTRAQPSQTAYPDEGTET